MDFERWTVVVVPFPFTDRARDRRRPAVIVSQPEALAKRVGHSVLAMVTSARNPSWPLDVPLSDHSGAGLEAPSVVRMKLFTLDHRFILRTIGHLGEHDRRAVAASLAALLGTRVHQHSVEADAFDLDLPARSGPRAAPDFSGPET